MLHFNTLKSPRASHIGGVRWLTGFGSGICRRPMGHENVWCRPSTGSMTPLWMVGKHMIGMGFVNVGRC